MPLKIGKKILKKTVSVAGAVIGIGTGGSLAIGETLTGDVIIDGVLLLGCFIIIAINGKDGVPEWIKNLASDRLNERKD